MRRLAWWFAGTTIFGILISTVPARVYTAKVSEPIPGTIAPTDFEKQYVEQFSDRIKWLETIAYAALGGIVGLRWSQEKLAAHPAVAISAGCLVVSLFNGYSAHDQVLQALQAHTPNLLSGVASRLTVICQFWFLATAVAVLAVRLLSVPRTVHRRTLCAFVVLIGSASFPGHADGAPAPPDLAVQACASDWVQTRFGRTANPEELTLLGSMVAGSANAKKIDLDQQNRCAFSASVLDFVLNGSYTLNGDREYSHFLEEAQSVARGVNHPGAGNSAIVTTLLNLAEIWHNARGVVYIVSSQNGDEVYVDNQRVGLTPFTCAMAPGKHKLLVKRNGTVIDTEQIEVGDGIELERKIK
jgi:PEGA domain